MRAARLARELQAALARADPPRALTVPTRRVAPRVTLADLVRHDRAYPIIDRAAFRLRLYVHPRPARSYPIAVGRQGSGPPPARTTSSGRRSTRRGECPTARRPARWPAGSSRPPQDPIKARRLAFNGGAGIHGTDDVASIGDPTSHGCIRMLIPDVNSLYDRVPVGSSVYVANALAPRRRNASDQSAKSARLTQPV